MICRAGAARTTMRDPEHATSVTTQSLYVANEVIAVRRTQLGEGNQCAAETASRFTIVVELEM